MNLKILPYAFMAVTLLATFHLGSSVGISQETASAKTGRLLEATGVSYKKIDDGIWGVSYKGENRNEITVIVTAYQEYVIIFTQVASAEDLSLTPAIMKRLLEVNDEVDWAKVGLDEKGDLFVRIDLSIRTVDKDELLQCILQTADVTDIVAGIVERPGPD